MTQPFDFQTWRTAAQQKLTQIQTFLSNQTAERGKDLYAVLGGLTLFPLAEAIGQAAAAGTSIPGTAYIALGTIAGGVGSNLIASRFEKWYEQAKNGDPVTEQDMPPSSGSLKTARPRRTSAPFSTTSTKR